MIEGRKPKDVTELKEDERYSAAVGTLSDRVRRTLERVPREIRLNATEIRLRTGRPLTLMVCTRPFFVEENGAVSPNPGAKPFLLDRSDLQECFVSLCGWSVHSHQKEVADGYISVRGGHRAGIAATAVLEEGKMTAVREITSVNLRIAREIYGAADPLIRGYLADRLRGILLVGAPASGKTTLLRDLARQLADGAVGRYVKVCVVDESGEIGAASGGGIQNDLGVCSDLLSGYPKDRGLQIALRYLSPEVIICDEVGSDREIEGITEAANSGVSVVTSIHAGSFAELSRRPQARKLIETGAFELIVLLAGAQRPAEITEVKRIGEVCTLF